ncbi:hypothetical protein SNEBB_005062 [Seison nebaliae]|nr:hypothetical protein SNEBB_005062 [Seison nebaliae]
MASPKDNDQSCMALSVDNQQEIIDYTEQYMRCQRKTYTYGVFGFLGAMSSVLILGEVYPKLIKNKKLVMPMALGAGIVSAFLVTNRRTQSCTKLWLSPDDK